jgi:5-methylcytosine-specific restriction endonuclease McrA
MTRERIPIEPRRVSPGTRAKILAATDHVCARPGCPERATDVDHILPLWLGGSNREKNLEGLCPDHHAAKTKAEASLRAKAKRREARDQGTRRPRQPIASRGFDKTQTRGFDGIVRPRDTQEKT